MTSKPHHTTASRRNLSNGHGLSTSEACGFAILLTLGATFGLGAPLMLAGITITPLHLAVGALVALAFLYKLSSTKTTAIAAVTLIAAAAIAIIVAGATFDFSFDGNDYHQEMAHAVASNAWNPYTQHLDDSQYWIFSTHYAMAFEWLAGCFESLTSSIECGKAVNYLLIIATALICHGAIAHRFGHWSSSRRIVLLCLLILNPVALCQLPTFYIDFTGYCYTLLTIVISLEIFSNHNRSANYIALCAVIILAAGTKFNTFFFEGLTIAAIALSIAIYRRDSLRAIIPYCATAAVTAIVSFALICYHPYITNLIAHGNPLYPLVGDGAVDIMSHNTPDIYLGHSRFANFFTSIFSISHPTVDQRIGGFGPLFSIIFVISLIAIAWSSAKQRRLSPIAYAAIVIIASAFVFEQSWWARYNPQLWLLAPLAYIAVADAASRWLRHAATAIALFALADSAICCLSIAEYISVEATYRHALYNQLRGHTATLSFSRPHFIQQLSEQGISARVDSVATADSLSRVSICIYRCSDYTHFPNAAVTHRQQQTIFQAVENDPFISFKRFIKGFIHNIFN
jgi:hypothetical protein